MAGVGRDRRGVELGIFLPAGRVAVRLDGSFHREGYAPFLVEAADKKTGAEKPLLWMCPQ